VKDGDEAVGANYFRDIKSVKLLLREGLAAPRLEVFAEAALLVKAKGVSLADAPRQILIFDGNALCGNLKTNDDLLARCELLGWLGAHGDDAVADCVMGARWHWVGLGFIGDVDRHDLFGLLVY
jgi:hypothetical protein